MMDSILNTHDQYKVFKPIIFWRNILRHPVLVFGQCPLFVKALYETNIRIREAKIFTCPFFNKKKSSLKEKLLSPSSDN